MSGESPASREFLGLAFDPLGGEAALRRVTELAASESFSYVVTPNVDHIVQIDRARDPAIRQAYDGASLRLCDSRILARLAASAKIDLPVVPGSDLTRELLEHGLPGGRVAVIGGDARLHGELAIRYPRFDWRFHSPPMGVRTNAAARNAIIAFVEASEAALVLFAIGAPQSELLCAAIAGRGRAHGTALCIGASLEFLTGAKRRAPRWMQRAGLEWLFRLLSEPRRLWRRYIVEGPRIFAIWWRWRRVSANRARSGSTRSGGG